MKVIVPHTNLREPTRLAVLGYSDDPVEFVKLLDDEHYWRLMRDLWAQAEDFCVIEHDIVIHANVLPEFRSCPHAWCSFGYPYGDARNYHGAGCVRYRERIMDAHPDLIERVGQMRGRNHPRRHWCSLDGMTRSLLWKAGERAHKHAPPVGHLDTATSHTCNGVF